MTLMMDINNPEFGRIRFEAVKGLKDSLRIVIESRYLGFNPEFQNRVRLKILNAVRGRSSVIVDLIGLSEIDSSFIGLLVNIRYEIRNNSGRMALMNINPDTWKVLDLMGLAAAFPVAFSLDQAITILRTDRVPSSETGPDVRRPLPVDSDDTTTQESHEAVPLEIIDMSEPEQAQQTNRSDEPEILEELEAVPDDLDIIGELEEISESDDSRPTANHSGIQLVLPEAADEKHLIQPQPGEPDLPPRRISRRAYERLCEVLSSVDQLLEALPDEKIQEFARSPYFEIYKNLFEELEIDSFRQSDGSTKNGISACTLSGRLRRQLSVVIPYMDSLIEQLPENSIRQLNRSLFLKKWRRIRRRYGSRSIPKTDTNRSRQPGVSRTLST